MREYLLSVCAVALICSIANRFLGKNGSGAAAKMVTSLVLVLAVVRPLVSMELSWESIDFNFTQQAQTVIAEGKQQMQNSMAEIIKEQTRAYILEKAQQFNANIEVAVQLSDQTVPTPVGVTLYGTVAPYAKQQLSDVIEKDLGISKEKQQWTLEK